MSSHYTNLLNWQLNFISVLISAFNFRGAGQITWKTQETGTAKRLPLLPYSTPPGIYFSDDYLMVRPALL